MATTNGFKDKDKVANSASLDDAMLLTGECMLTLSQGVIYYYKVNRYIYTL